MKPILINEKNIKKIEIYLMEVNGLGRERLLSHYDELETIISHVENKLKYTKKKNRNGLKVIYREGASKFPKAYKYSADGTTVILTYNNNKWYLEKAIRSDVRNKKVFDMYYPEELQKELIYLLEHLELY